VPALTLADSNGETRTSDYFNVSTSYFKMRNVQFGYTLPGGTLNGVRNLRLYLMAENVLLLKNSGFQGPDPERTDANAIPVPRAITFGLNLSL
jgi:hypothetical protein